MNWPKGGLYYMVVLKDAPPVAQIIEKKATFPTFKLISKTNAKRKYL